MSYERGDWVVFDDGFRRKAGRVWRMGEGVAFVCFHRGCTAAATPLSMLRPYDREADAGIPADAMVGFHRFDGSCPDYEPMFCGDCDKGGDER